MKKILLILVLFLGISSLASNVLAADLWGYTIDTYDVKLAVQQNWSMNVIETIWVNFTSARHGIYREIPTKDIAGRYIQINNFDAQDDPVAANSVVNGLYTLKIGDANTLISGPKQYTITYTVQNAITQYLSWQNVNTGSWQELYWNIIGNARNVGIRKITFSIDLPKAANFGSGEAFLVYGPQWAKFTTWAVLHQTTPTHFIWSLTTALKPKEWATIWLKFPLWYFALPAWYERLGIARTDYATPTQTSTDSNSSRSSYIWSLIKFGFMLFIAFFAARAKRGWSTSGKKPAWSSSKTVTVYYTPPKDIQPPQWFRFRYDAKNPRVFTALIYYRATRWRVTINKIQDKKLFWLIKNDSFHIAETSTKPKGTTALDDLLLQSFFGEYDDTKDDVAINRNTYTKADNVLSLLENDVDNKTKLYAPSGWWFFPKDNLTDLWADMFEQLRGYKEFLEKVERPVIEKELQSNPDFINTILPRAILFGVETNLLGMIEDLLAKTSAQWYSSYDWRPLSVSSFRVMNAALISNSMAPRSSGGSWFSWGGGFSGGGWGGGWGGSR